MTQVCLSVFFSFQKIPPVRHQKKTSLRYRGATAKYLCCDLSLLDKSVEHITLSKICRHTHTKGGLSKGRKCTPSWGPTAPLIVGSKECRANYAGPPLWPHCMIRTQASTWTLRTTWHHKKKEKEQVRMTGAPLNPRYVPARTTARANRIWD